MKTMSGSSVMVGIDVASAHVDVAAIGAELPATLNQVGNDAEGHSALADGLARLQPELVLMEATGGYEAALACALQAAGLRVAVVNPRMARDFARAMQRLAKTDRIDAATLAEFAGVLARKPDCARFIRPLSGTRAAGSGCAGDASPPVGVHAARRAPAAAAGAAGGTIEHRGPARGDRASTR